MSKIMSDFHPQVHGFHFGNRFDNVIFKNELGSWTTHGRCGGMAFAALDYYYAKLPIPTHQGSDFPGGLIPSSNSRLSGYIYDRLMDSFVKNGWKFITWTEKLDHDTWVYGEGLPKLTKRDEFPKLLQRLENGPVALGLIKAEHIWDIGINHQVVAYGAELDKATGTMTVYIYDNNAPDWEVTLTSDPYQPHFTSSLMDINGNHFWYRGWFVEDYSPKLPTYIDLAVVKNLSLSPAYPYLGDPLDCTYTVKNFGDFPSNISQLNVDVAVPKGEMTGPKFRPDTTATSLQPQQEHIFAKHCDCFALTKGKYTLNVACEQQPGIKIDLPTAFSLGSAVAFVPTREVVVDVKYFSIRIVAPPPCVESVEAIYVKDGASGTLKSCEQPRVKYQASWVPGSTGSTQTLDAFSEPIIPIPGKTLVFNIKFSTSGAIKKGTAKLTLVGKASDGSSENITLPLTGSGDFFTGTWKPQHKGSANYMLALRIEGADDTPRYAGRTPLGNILDSKPQTAASVDTTSAGYPFKNYEPGADSNYSIELAPKRATMTADALEPNDSFTAASQVILTGATADKGVWKRFDHLNFHGASDQDFFFVQYVSLPGDDACQLTGSTTVSASDFLGLSITSYPPSLCISVNAEGSCTDIDVYKIVAAGTQLYKSHAKERLFSLFNPTKVFPNKTLYAVIRNSNYTYQGAFPYDVDFGYMPAHSVWEVDTNAPAYSARPDARRRLLKRYYDMIDLPRPGDTLLSKATDASFPYPANSIIVTNLKKSLTNQQAYLTSPDTMSDLKAVAPKQANDVVATALMNLGKIAQSAQLDKQTEALYLASAASFATAKMRDNQIIVLRALASFYKDHQMSVEYAEVKNQISKIKTR